MSFEKKIKLLCVIIWLAAFIRKCQVMSRIITSHNIGRYACIVNIRFTNLIDIIQNKVKNINAYTL